METTETPLAERTDFIQLQWKCYNPPADAKLAWGARAIFTSGVKQDWYFKNGKKRKTPLTVSFVTVDLLHDRQELKGGEENERGKFGRWISMVCLPKIKEMCLKSGLSPADKVAFTFEMDGYSVEFSPKASHGYLYITAYKVPG